MEPTPSDPRSTERPPRLAATLVLLRDSGGGLEVLATVRPKHLRFMGGATVFPGGALADADRDPDWDDLSDLDGDAAAAALGLEDGREALAFYICALRESLEEVGFMPGSTTGRRIDREAADDASRFLERCRAMEAVLPASQLVPAGRWVTPLGSPIRFDTRFFLTEAPPDWQPDPDPEEVESARWASPSVLLTELAAGSLLMAPPTIEMLQRLDAFGSTEEALVSLGGSGLAGSGNVLSVRLSPLVHVVLAPNPGVMTGPGTNTYIVGSGPTVVIDPAVDDPEYLEAVLSAAGEVAQILITHRHSDHTGGVVELARRTGAPVRAWGEETAGGAPVEPLSEGEVITAGAARLVTHHAPGHASDHVVFAMEDVASLIAGDNILGEGTAVIAPPDGDMGAFMATLDRLVKLNIDRIYPGHFRPLDGGRAVIEQLIAHRRAREAMILEALGRDPISVEDVVAVVYADTPAHLHPVARYSVLAHLEALEKSSAARRDGELWSRA
jgi:glyoxylase-like metal-dependent hydrolase (beta-lactamase superfamily II)/8-oxo-dGTP pyrophosphatase MutT (NUDIX family)